MDARAIGFRHLRWVFPLVVLWLSGCTTFPEYVRNGFKVGPNYAPPPAVVAPQWIDAADKRVRSDSDDLSQWWTNFEDPALNELVCNAYRQNLTLREAGFRVLQARADYGITVGEMFPQSQFANASYTRNLTSIAGLLGGSFGSFAPGGGAARGFRRYFNQNAVNFGVAWELDFWGRYRRAIEASSAQLDASVHDYDDVLVTLLADVATNYVQMRVLQEQIDLLNENAKLQKDTLKIAQAKRDAGAKGSELDYPQAKTTLQQTLAQIPPTEIRLRFRVNRLCVLLGMPPEELAKRLDARHKRLPIPKTPEQAAAGVPAELLRRRPDVRRAERLAAAECARIGVAEAMLYPHITISGTMGWQAPRISQFFTKNAFQGNYGPSIQWDVLNYGRLYNGVRFQRARFDEIVTAYQNKVLSAAEEVENGIVTFVKSHEQVAYLKESVEAAKEAQRIGAAQLKLGKIDFNRQAVLELNLVNQQNLLAQAKGDVALGLIQVYRALGGGWEIRCDECAEAPLPPSAAVIVHADQAKRVRHGHGRPATLGSPNEIVPVPEKPYANGNGGRK